MTNLERWRFFMKDCKSPDSYIDMSFYFMISACLQRRVWLNSEFNPLFFNQYLVLVGGPGIGKGMAMKPVIQMLKFHKAVTQDKHINAVDITSAAMDGVHGKVADPDADLLFPMAPNSCSFEQLVREFSEVIRTIRVEIKKPDGSVEKKIVTHKSLCCVLEELGSLIAKDRDKVITFLLQAFDCGDYDYKTKHQGKDLLRKLCLNLMGGCTPAFMQDAFTEKIIGEGFSGRTIFVYEFANRFNKFAMSEYSAEQLKARNEVLAHIHGLSRLYGQVQYTPGAFEILRSYFEDELPKHRVNLNPKLEPYYTRKDILVQKLAGAIHFADSYSLVINEQEVTQALEVLARLEKKMHLALSFGKNPIAAYGARITLFIQKAGPQTFESLWAEFGSDLREMELKECLNFLCGTFKLTQVPYDGIMKYTIVP